ncbi:protein of unknown function (plasmid) [Cupriavidus taiwanensis]|uniref:Uncharacterized protein n=1 Tax=Cupriavidus taiwanensis TaxID=164546 RepID=A0A9Q7XSG2_9BURK|nr:protein of unknown function [Cupriavidus taiwanensis]
MGPRLPALRAGTEFGLPRRCVLQPGRQLPAHLAQCAGGGMAHRRTGGADLGAEQRVLPAAGYAPVLLHRPAHRAGTAPGQCVPGQHAHRHLRRAPLRPGARRRQPVHQVRRAARRGAGRLGARHAQHRPGVAGAGSGQHPARGHHWAAVFRPARQRGFPPLRLCGRGADLRLATGARSRPDLYQGAGRRHLCPFVRRPYAVVRLQGRRQPRGQAAAELRPVPVGRLPAAVRLRDRAADGRQHAVCAAGVLQQAGAADPAAGRLRRLLAGGWPRGGSAGAGQPDRAAQVRLAVPGARQPARAAVPGLWPRGGRRVQLLPVSGQTVLTRRGNVRLPYPSKVVCNVLIQMSILFPVTKTPS